MTLKLFNLANLVLLFSLTYVRATDPKPPPGFQAIFNGKDLSGWYGLEPHTAHNLSGDARTAVLAKMRDEFYRHWRVEDGELINDGLGPYATTEAEYGNYELMLEYKTVPGADSGIYLRGSPQVQIWDTNQAYDHSKPDRHPYLGSGGLFNNKPRTLGRDPLIFADKPIGQWNAFIIRHIKNRVWVKLNNKQVVDGAIMENFWDSLQDLPSTGPLMLQTHGGEIRWRNIFIRQIESAEAKKALESKLIPDPTLYNISYGSHPKQLIHFWKAESDRPSPLLLFIHGGGWMSGGRLNGLTTILEDFLRAGISVASIEYRFISEAMDEGIVPPVRAPLHDAARALQYIRSQASAWNIDKSRIAASGGSAGACTSLWLAFHDDLADPSNEDPIAHESTRLLCAAVTGAQTTLDPKQMREWTPNSRYGGHAFGFMPNAKDRDSQFDQFYLNREHLLPWIEEYSPYALVSSGDPPVFLQYASRPALGEFQKDPTHTANFGVKLQERCQANGVKCELFYPGVPNSTYTSIKDYLIAQLKQIP